MSSSPASLNRGGELPRQPSSSRPCSSASRTSSSHSQKSGKLSFTPITTIADLHPYPKHRPVAGPALIPADAQIQRVNLAPTMTVSSTPVPPGVGAIFSGVATSGAPSVPLYRNTPLSSATYVSSNNTVANGFVNTGVRNKGGYDYVANISPVVGRTYMAESHPVLQTATAVGVPGHPVNVYTSTPIANGVMRGVSQPVVMSPHGVAGTFTGQVGSLQGNNYTMGHPTPQYGMSTCNPNYPYEYNTAVAVPTNMHPEYSVHVLPVTVSQPMVVSSHPHIPQPIAPQQCLPVKSRPAPSSQASTLPLPVASLDTSNITTQSTLPQMAPAQMAPPQMLPTQPPQITQQVAPLQLPQQMAPPQPSMILQVSPPLSSDVTPPSMAKSLIVAPTNVGELLQQPPVDHTVTVDIHTTGPSTPLTVLPPTTVASSPEYLGSEHERPPTITVAPPVTTVQAVAPTSSAAVDFSSSPSLPSSVQTSDTSSTPSQPRSSPARGQRCGLVPTGEAWGFSSNESTPRSGNRSQPRHHSMGRYDQVSYTGF